MENGEYFALDEKSAAEYACAKGFFAVMEQTCAVRRLGTGI